MHIMKNNGLKWYERLLLNALSLFLRLWWRSLRITLSPEQREILLKDEPYVIVFWHQKLFVAGELKRRLRPTHPMAAIISASKDGEWLAQLLHKLRIQALRGSSSRHGQTVLAQSIARLHEGCDVAITPDGPKGPPQAMKLGAIHAALRGNARLVAVRVTYGRALHLSSWDHFQIPLPFSRVKLEMKTFSPAELAPLDERLAAETIGSFLSMS